MQPLKFGAHGSLEDLALETRDATASHSGLIDAVQNTGDGREEVGFQELSILKETEGITAEIPNATSNSDSAELTNTL